MNSHDQEATRYSLSDIKKLKADLSRASLEDLTAPVETPYSDENSSSLICSIFQPLFELYKSTNDFHLKVACGDTLATWLTKASKTIDQSPDMLTEVSSIFRGTFIFNSLYNFMLSDWDIGGPIHAPLKDIFSKSLILQKQVCKTHLEEQRKLLRCVLEMDRSQKSVYYALEILRKQLGTSAILHYEPTFFSDRLQDMRDASITTPLGRLLSNVILSKLPDKATVGEELDWLELWRTTITSSLLSTDREHVSSIFTYLLPPLFKASEKAFSQFLLRLLEQGQATDHARLLLIVTNSLRKAKDVQIIKEVDQELFAKYRLPSDLLSQLLTHPQPTLRVAALDLLASHPKTTTQFPQSTFDLFRESLPYCFHETDMQFRKETLDALRSFFVRFHGSLQNTKPLLRKADAKQDHQAKQDLLYYIDGSHAFAKWLVAFLKANLEPGNGFQVTYMSLQTLQMASGLGWHAGDAAASQKYSAFPIAKGSNQQMKPVLPFSIDLFDGEMARLLLDRLGDSFDDNRTLAISLLSALPNPLPGLRTTADLNLVILNSQRLLKSVRGRDGDGGARTLQFLFERFLLPDHPIARDLIEHDFMPSSGTAVRFIESILHSIDDDTNLARTNMLAASQDHAIHGRLNAVRYMIDSVDYNQPSIQEAAEQWTAVHAHILKSSHLIWIAVRDVLCDDSPEGSLPMSVQQQQSTSLRGPETQVVLSFCWRALREASSLLRSVIVCAPFSMKASMLKEKDFSDAGELFLVWLTEIRHRGAFSAVFPNFVDVVKRLQGLQDYPELSRLPWQWLQRNIDQLRSVSHSKDITRRSGGLPMSIISFMIAETESTNVSKKMVHSAMKQLIDLAVSPIRVVDENLEYPQVHGLNTLKDIFLESKLAAWSVDYVERCFLISLDGFCSPLWAIRNCSLMLFSSLIRRSFGARLPRAESSTKTFSARTFFKRYPKVLDRMTEELRSAATDLFSHEAPSMTTGLHPCLTLLSRLDLDEPSDMEDDTDFDTLIQLLSKIATCRIWQVRSMAAQAIPTFVEPELVGSFIVQQLNLATIKDQNGLHGRLLMVHHLLEYSLTRNNNNKLFIDQVLGDLRRAIFNKLAEFTSENPCAATEAVWLRILLFLGQSTAREMNVSLRQRTVDYCARELADRSNKRQGVVGAATLYQAMTSIIMRALADTSFRWLQSAPRSIVLKELLEGPRHEVRLRIYETLCDVFPSTSAVMRAPSLRTTLENRCTAETWPVTRNAAKRCLASLPLPTGPVQNETSNALLELNLVDLETQGDVASDAEYTLTLVGQLFRRSTAQEHTARYLAVLQKYSEDNVPVEARVGVLQSLKASRICDPIFTENASEDLNIEEVLPFVALLLRQLTDDDENLRQDTSDFVCEDLLHSPPRLPEQTCKVLLETLTSKYPRSKQLIRAFIHDVVPDQSPKTQLSVALNPSGLLFAIESQNLWRNPLTQCTQALSGLTHMELESPDTEPLVMWTTESISAILFQIESKIPDGPLGWSSIPEVWRLLRRTLLITKFIYGRREVSADIKDSLRERMTGLRVATQDLHLHPSLVRELKALEQ